MSRDNLREQLLHKLADMCELEQIRANKYSELGGVLNLNARDRHIARSRAFLDVVKVIKEVFDGPTS
jgi:hypothetical protein